MDEDNDNKLWTTGATEAQLTEICLPRMLALPGFLVDSILAKGHCLPHHVRRMVMEHIDGGGTQLDAATWQLVLDWCLVASQTDANGSSLLQLSTIKPVMSQDPEFVKWAEQLPWSSATNRNRGGTWGKMGCSWWNESQHRWGKLSWRVCRPWHRACHTLRGDNKTLGIRWRITKWGEKYIQKISWQH